MASYKHEARDSLLSGEPQTRPYPMASRDSSFGPYAGGYHQREGLAPAYPETPSKFQAWRYIPDSKWQWFFIAIPVAETVIALALEIIIFVDFQDTLATIYPHKSINKVVPTYLSLFICGFLFMLFLVYDALRLKNTIQVIGLCLYNVGLLVEAAIQLDQIETVVKNYTPSNPAGNPGGVDSLQSVSDKFQNEVRPIVIALPVLLGFGTALMSWVAWKLYDEFAWSIYKHISADLRLKRRYLTYQIYIGLLKFDYFFFLAFTIQFIVIVPVANKVEEPLTIAALPLTILMLMLAAYFTRHEIMWGMVLLIFFWLSGLAYFFFKLFRMFFGPADRVEQYEPTRGSLVTFACITIALLVVTLVYHIMCMVNFNKGLKPHVMSRMRMRRRQASQDFDKMMESDVPLAISGGPRMEID